MGNQIDKVLDGLYVGGFLGQFLYWFLCCHQLSLVQSLAESVLYSHCVYCVGANQKEKLTSNNITHVLAIHDTAEAHWPKVS